MIPEYDCTIQLSTSNTRANDITDELSLLGCRKPSWSTKLIQGGLVTHTWVMIDASPAVIYVLWLFRCQATTCINADILPIEQISVWFEYICISLSAGNAIVLCWHQCVEFHIFDWNCPLYLSIGALLLTKHRRKIAFPPIIYNILVLKLSVYKLIMT